MNQKSTDVSHRAASSHGGLASRWLRALCWAVLLLPGGSLLADSEPQAWQVLSLLDAEDHEMQVRVLPAEGPWLMIWPLSRSQLDPGFEQMLRRINQLGVEVWWADLLAAQFLPPSHENRRRLSGSGVAALLEAAQRRSDKRLLLAAYDRMALPLLRGARQWQQTAADGSRLAGGLLFFPNLFGPAPVAGEAPDLDPILAYSNIPLVFLQPENGTHRWRAKAMLQALWDAGAPAYWVLLPGVQNFYFMQEEQQIGPNRQASLATPVRVLEYARLLGATPRSAAAVAGEPPPIAGYTARELVPLQPPRPAPALGLRDMQGRLHRLSDYRGQVLMVNFWATWCPPCVEEIGAMNQLAERYKHKDFRILSVDFRETLEHLQAFRQRVPIDFPVMLDLDGRVAEAWQVFAFPSTFILDRQGRIRFTANQALHWDSQAVWTHLDALLGEAP